MLGMRDGAACSPKAETWAFEAPPSGSNRFEAGSRREPQLARWEYAWIKVFSLRVVVHYYTSQGIEYEEAEPSNEIRAKGNADLVLARTIAQMGEAGWEVFQVDPGGTYHLRRENLAP